MLAFIAHATATPPGIQPGRTCRVGASIVPGACHVGARGLGMLGADILAATAAGEHGAGMMFNDSLSPDREYRLVITNSTFAPGALQVFEDGSIDFTGPGTATQTLYEHSVQVGSSAVLDAAFVAPNAGAVQGLQLQRSMAPVAATYGPPGYNGALASWAQAPALQPLAGAYVVPTQVAPMTLAQLMQGLVGGTYVEAWKSALKEYTLLAPVDQIDNLGGFAAKAPEARVTLAFEFKRFSPAPSSCVVTVMQERGPTDPAAQDILEGEPAILGSKVYQRVRLGKANCDYRLTCLLEDQAGSAYVLRGVLPVRDA